MARAVEDEVFEHDYDGIQEYDNPMPGWWLWIFYLTIGFGVIYYPFFHWGPGKLPAERYEAEMLAAAERYPEPEPISASVDLAALFEEPTVLAAGAEIYSKNCSPCHTADGGGLVGPNLTDPYWVHGGQAEDIVNTVTQGVPEKGMIAWSSILSPDEIIAVSAHVASLEGTTPASPKAPEGERVGEGG